MMSVHVVQAKNIKTVTEQTTNRKERLKIMKLKRGLICIAAILALTIQIVEAQEKGEVKEVKDTAILQLQEFRAAMKINPVESNTVVVPSGSINTVNPSTTTTKPVIRSAATRVKVRGFRVQIFAGSNRNQAFAEQTRFRSMYKDVDTYITYDEPNYRVKVGDFRSRSSANNLMRELRQYFKNVFVFSESVFVYQ